MTLTATSTKTPTQPQRTCVGCRKTSLQSELLRAVADATGRLHFDSGRWRSAGRGCYIHRAAPCMQAAVRGGFERSMRRRLRVSDDEIRAVLAAGDKR